MSLASAGWIYKNIALACCLIGLSETARGSGQAVNLNWLAFGDLRGSIETCGCDPRTDLGGIARLGTLLARERAQHPDALVFDLGNNFIRHSNLKNKFLAKGLKALSLDAALVNDAELELAPEFWVHERSLLGNLKPQHPAFALTKRYLARQGALIMGYHWSAEHKAQLAPWDQGLAESFKQVLTKFPQHKKVLLFSGPQRDLKAIVATSWFDLVVSSNTSSQNAPMNFIEKQDPRRLLRLAEPAFVRMVPLGGVGVLRGGKLLSQVAPALPELLSPPPGPAPSSKPQLALTSYDISWLDHSYAANSPLTALMQEYNEAVAAAFKQAANSRKQDLKHSPFAGAASCKQCHLGAYQAWAASAHASAYNTLSRVGKEQDPECVSCHVLGFGKKGGFVSKEASPQFAHVQCENCHGPRREHTQNPQRQATADPKQSCTGCHHIPHSANFSYEQYWHKIKHGSQTLP